MNDELRFHIQSYAEDLERQGVAAPEALRRARLAFGAVESHKEDCRQSLGLQLWDELQADLRSGFRVLRQSPVFTTVAVVSLALGIGANTAIFTLANEFLLKSMSVPNADRLRVLTWVEGTKRLVGHVWGTFEKNELGEGTAAAFPYPLYREMQQHNRVTANQVMEDMAGFKDIYRLTAVVSGEAEAVDGMLVSGNFYRCLGVRVEAGRPILETDDSPSSNSVAVISDAYWARRFKRSASALGASIRVNNVPLTIVGVNVPEFKSPKSGGSPDVFVPLTMQPAIIPRDDGPVISQNNSWWVVIMGRLKPGITDEAASAALTQSYRSAWHDTIPGKKDADIPRLVLKPGNRGLDMGEKRMRKPVFLLLGAAGLVLLIACANLANLLLARASVRQREISLRLAMGAGRGRIMRQILTESLLLAFLGGAAGLLLGYAARNFIPRLLDSDSIDASMDWRVFSFAFVITLATGLLFGIAPAWRSTRADVNSALKETGRMTASQSKAWFGKALVVFQIALSLVLVVGAGLFLRTLLNLHNAPTGINPEHIVLFQLNPPISQYSMARRITLYQQISDQLAVIPGVERTTSSSQPLLANDTDTDCYQPAVELPGTDKSDKWTNYVGPDFFSTLGIPMVRGRAIERRDNQNAPRVAVINRRLARQFFPDRNPVGQTIRTCGEKAISFEVVGLSADAKYSEVRGEAPPTIYIPFAQAEYVMSMTFEIKTAASLASVIPNIRAAVGAVDKDIPLLQLRTQIQQIDATLTMERLFAALTSGFGFLAVILASIGIYGVMAYTVSRRTNEIGIRMALGAQARQVLAMVLAETSVLACLGIVAGLASAFAATRLVSAMLFGLEPRDPATFATGALLLLAIAFLAAVVPAWRASRVDPHIALRHE